MQQVLIDKLGSTTSMTHYYDSTQSNKVPEWNLEYKNQVMTMLIPIFADMKPTCAQMEDLLSSGQTNPFDVTLDTMTTLALT